MRFTLVVSMIMLLCTALPAVGAGEPMVVNLWPAAPPEENGDIGAEMVRLPRKSDIRHVEVTEQTRLVTNVTEPSLTIYRPAKEKDTGTAVLICPGGGYWDLYWQLEGEEVAGWLNSIGVTGIILKYRVPRRPDEVKGEPARRPLQDAQRAISLVRSNAERWGIRPQQIGMVGFSAGGHLVIATATSFEKRTYEPVDDVDKISCRPDFAIGVYSGYLKARDKDEISPGLHVPAATPPIFLAHGGNDIVSPPEHSVLMYLALRKAGVPAELHVYATASHDFGVRPVDQPCSTWTQSCEAWLRHQGFLQTIDGRDNVNPSIRRLISDVDPERISKHVFYLAKDPIPFRKLNLTLPGHEKNTLYEADDYLAGQLESWGYSVKREGVQVQAFRRDRSKPKHAQYSTPKPEDPWYTAYNLYAERTGRVHPEKIILILAHKDSQSWIDSPGANDNAIGTVGVLEMARVLAGYSPECTIRFLFCNEEHRPWTSRTAAQKAKERGDNLVAIFNTDGIGVKTAEDTAAGKKTNVTAYTEPEGKKLADLMAEVNTRYSIGLEQRTYQRQRPGDDDGSFVQAGFPVAVINIGSYPYGDPNYHAEGDTPETCDVKNAAMAVQATLAAVLTVDQGR